MRNLFWFLIWIYLYNKGMGEKFMNDNDFMSLWYVELEDRSKAARSSRITGRASVQGGNERF